MRSEVMKGLDRMSQRLTTQDFIGKPTGAFLRDWKEDLKREAVQRAPEWQHNLKDTILNAQDTRRFPLWARVFTDSPQGRWTEYGTGLLSEDPDSAHQRYFPSVEGVRSWAEDKGWDPFQLALHIYNMGGTAPLHWFSDAEEAADSHLADKMSMWGTRIENEAARGTS